MSRRSDQDIAGLIGFAALAGAAAYAGYQWFSTNQTAEAPHNQRPSLPSPPPRRAEPPKVCPVCNENIPASELITLDCSHPYHRTCLHANHILHMAELNFKCPIRSCQRIVPEDRLKYFLNI